MVQTSDLPYKFQGQWAQIAGGGYLTTPITPTAASPRASQQLGFPPATATEIGAGGTPPNIADFNGLGYYITGWLIWLQCGGPITFDAGFPTSAPGYPLGAVLSANPPAGNYWISQKENNTTDPDAGPSVDWKSLFGNMFKTITQYTPPTRDLAVVYTNNTGNPMQVTALGISTGAGPNFAIHVNGMVVWSLGAPQGGYSISCTAMVPPDATYEVISVPGPGATGITLLNWIEFTQG